MNTSQKRRRRDADIWSAVAARRRRRTALRRCSQCWVGACKTLVFGLTATAMRYILPKVTPSVTSVTFHQNYNNAHDLHVCGLKFDWRVEFDVSSVSSESSSSCRVCRAVLFDKLDTAKMHGLDTSNVSCRVETWRASGIFAVVLHKQRIAVVIS